MNTNKHYILKIENGFKLHQNLCLTLRNLSPDKVILTLMFLYIPYFSVWKRNLRWSGERYIPEKKTTENFILLFVSMYLILKFLSKHFFFQRYKIFLFLLEKYRTDVIGIRLTYSIVFKNFLFVQQIGNNFHLIVLIRSCTNLCINSLLFVILKLR